MLGKYFCHNGKLLPASKSKVDIDRIEFTYGFGVYENLKVRQGKIYFIPDHLDRLIHSAKVIGLEHSFKKIEMTNWLENLVIKNKIEAGNLKMILIGGSNPDLYILTLAPKFLDRKYYRDGVKVITYNYERFLPAAKTLNMLPSYLIYKKAGEAEAHDALLIDKKGNITEGTRANFFVIKNKTIYTPPVEQVLDGVTRRTVIDCAKQNGFQVKEQEIKLVKLFTYAGAFLTHTSGKIVPICVVEEAGKELGSFSIIDSNLKDLINLYNDYLKKYAEKI